MGRLALPLLAILAVLLPVAVAQEVRPSGIGMSGSLWALSPIIVPQGGTVSSDSYFIVVYNFMDKPVKVVLRYEAPRGINITFNPSPGDGVVIEPRGYRRFQVVIHVSDTMPPGEYNVSIMAYAVREVEPGKISLVPGALERAIIRVVGQYSLIHVYVVDPMGKTASTALVRLYSIVKGRMVSVADSWGGRLDAKVIPGNYTIKVYMAGEEVASKNIVLKPFEDRKVRLEARVAYIEQFLIRPILRDDNVIGVTVKTVVKNLYRTLSGVTLTLIVERDGKEVDRRDLVSSSILPPGRSQYSFDYVPPEGFTPGNYTFRIVLFVAGKPLSAAGPQWLYIPPKPPILLALLIAVAVALLALLLRHLGRGRRHQQ